MAELLNQDEFRSALEGAMAGRQAKDASFSQAWATGKLERKHFARWAENHYHYVGPFADYLAYIYANTPDTATDAKDFLLQNMWEEEIGDVRHTDLLAPVCVGIVFGFGAEGYRLGLLGLIAHLRQPTT